jgi:FixJ family two-component response regulator
MHAQGSVAEGYKVHVVDDDDDFRTGLTRVLNASGLRAVGYRCAGEFLLADVSATPGCVVLDVCMPGPSGIELLDALAMREFSLPVIFVTGCSDVSTSVHAIRSGAVNFLTKPVRTEALLDSVRSAIEVDIERRAEQLEGRTLRERYETLTERELAVFAGVVDGRLNKQLAIELNTCERTIKSHRARMMKKLHATSLADLVRAAKLLGISRGRAMG